MAYKENREWSDQFIPQIKQIVGPYLLEKSSFEVDTQQAADLVVITARSLTIACRVRKPGYYEKWSNEFTIRSRNNGHRTELQKITDGWGDWMFYGHATSGLITPDNTIHAWMLINLNAFRAQLIRNRRQLRKGQKVNEPPDGTYFTWFDITSFADNPALIIASQNISIPKSNGNGYGNYTHEALLHDQAHSRWNNA